jgi:predicted DNA-binding transcriptional regulator AlpA
MSVQLPANAGPPRRPLIPAHDRLGLSRVEAAEYIGVSARLFDELVQDGQMPQPKMIKSRRVWMRSKLEKAFAELPEDGQDKESANPWRDCA